MPEALIIIAAMLVAIAGLGCVSEAVRSYQAASPSAATFWGTLSVCMVACSVCTILFAIGVRA
jgi:hypothetical protein